jgi:hypothetical protein
MGGEQPDGGLIEIKAGDADRQIEPLGVPVHPTVAEREVEPDLRVCRKEFGEDGVALGHGERRRGASVDRPAG